MKQLFQPQCHETRNQLQQKTGKNTNTQRLNNMLLKNQWIKEDIKQEMKNNLEGSKMAAEQMEATFTGLQDQTGITTKIQSNQIK